MNKRIEPVKKYDGEGKLKEVVHPKPSQLNYEEGKTNAGKFLALKDRLRKRRKPRP